MIGKKLVDLALEALKKEEINKVLLVAFKKNEGGNAFWESQGFTLREDLNYRNKALAEMIRIDPDYLKNLLLQDNCECELNNLAVLPEYRHQGIGRKLLDHSYESARDCGCKLINIGIVEENRLLRKWYEQNGAVHTGTKKFDFFPFTCGYMVKKI